ncbi:STX5 protein, partial [Crocuta crocuta]
MGCCQDKDFQTSEEQGKEADSDEAEGGTRDTPTGPREREKGLPRRGSPRRLGRGERSGAQWPRHPAGADEVDMDAQDPKSNESLLITVLWRRLSLFSRRGSRSNKRLSAQSQKHGLPQSKRDVILEEPEKG